MTTGRTTTERTTTERMARLAELMGRMADGDPSAVWTLFDEYGDDIARAVRHHARHLGMDRLEPDDLRGLVVDVCLMLAERAGSWDPAAGAAPWTWASRRVAALVGAFVGQRAEPLDDTAAGQQPARSWRTGAAEDDALALLDRTAGHDEVAALFREALRDAASDRNGQVLLEVHVQTVLGDPSPSITVGRALGLRPDAVRQICKRTSDRLAEVLRSDPRYASLIGVTIVATGRRPRAGSGDLQRRAA